MKMVSDARPYQYQFFFVFFRSSYIFYIRNEITAVVWFGIQKNHLP
jgi:hypothetical protein